MNTKLLTEFKETNWFKLILGFGFLSYLLGVIIDNTFLGNYGAFSWFIIDFGNLSSGIILLIILLGLSEFINIFILLFLQKEIESKKSTTGYYVDFLTTLFIKCPKINNCSSFLNFIKIVLKVLLMVYTVIYFCCDLNKTCMVYLFLTSCLTYSVFLSVNFLSLILSNINVDVNDTSKSLDNKDKNDPQIDNDKIEAQNNNIAKFHVAEMNVAELHITDVHKAVISKAKEEKENKVLSYDILVMFLLIPIAIFFGDSLYSEIPRNIGGGKPLYVKFGPNDLLKDYIEFDKTYQLLDETFSNYFVYDEEFNQVILVPAINKDFGPMRFVQTPDISLSFVADMHFTNESNLVNKGISFESFDTILEYWSCNSELKNLFLLGDIIEAPPYDPNLIIPKIDSVYANQIGILQYYLQSNAQVTSKMNAVIGNNDCRDTLQLNYFRTFMNNNGFKNRMVLPGIEWEYDINEDIGVIGLYLPDKIYWEGFDSTWFNPRRDTIIFQLESLLKEKSDKDIILILTHQGFVVENPWSQQFDIKRSKSNKILGHVRNLPEDSFIKLNRKDHKNILDLLGWRDGTKKRVGEIINLVNKQIDMNYNPWTKFVTQISEMLRDYDNDFNPVKHKPDIVVISGHYHDGVITRRLDGIDHIVCPSFFEGTRGTNHFERPIMNLNLNTNINKIDIIYKSLRNKEEKARTTLWY